MKITVEVPLPSNLSEENAGLFQPFKTFELQTIKIQKLKNVFVCYSGLCISDKGLIKESHHFYDYQYENYLSEASHYYNLAKTSPENLIILDNDNTYLVIHHPWYNYYHWLCECIFRLWSVRDHVDNMILVLPDYYEYVDFIKGSLEPFKLKNIMFIPQGKSLLVKKLCLPQIKPYCDSYDYKLLREVREFYLSYVLKESKLNINLGKKLYLSRKKAGRKHVINEDQVIEEVEKCGFNVIYNEDHNFLEQVAIYSNAKFLISIHGSGLTNMLFMKENSSVLEIHKRRTNDLDHPSFVFWYEAAGLDFNYFHQLSEDLENENDYFHGDFKIDIGQLRDNINLMVSNDSK